MTKTEIEAAAFRRLLKHHSAFLIEVLLFSLSRLLDYNLFQLSH